MSFYHQSDQSSPYPVPFGPFLESLALELDRKRLQNALLMSELFSERQRSQELWMRLNDVSSNLRAPLSPTTQGMNSGEAEQNRGKIIGKYTLETRMLKIAKYKAKMQEHLARARKFRSCKGRSQVARGKPRIRGRFVKTQDDL